MKISRIGRRNSFEDELVKIFDAKNIGFSKVAGPSVAGILADLPGLSIRSGEAITWTGAAKTAMNIGNLNLNIPEARINVALIARILDIEVGSVANGGTVARLDGLKTSSLDELTKSLQSLIDNRIAFIEQISPMIQGAPKYVNGLVDAYKGLDAGKIAKGLAIDSLIDSSAGMFSEVSSPLGKLTASSSVDEITNSGLIPKLGDILDTKIFLFDGKKWSVASLGEITRVVGKPGDEVTLGEVFAMAARGAIDGVESAHPGELVGGLKLIMGDNPLLTGATGRAQFVVSSELSVSSEFMEVIRFVDAEQRTNTGIFGTRGQLASRGIWRAADEVVTEPEAPVIPRDVEVDVTDAPDPPAPRSTDEAILEDHPWAVEPVAAEQPPRTLDEVAEGVAPRDPTEAPELSTEEVTRVSATDTLTFVDSAGKEWLVDGTPIWNVGPGEVEVGDIVVAVLRVGDDIDVSSGPYTVRAVRGTDEIYVKLLNAADEGDIAFDEFRIIDDFRRVSLAEEGAPAVRPADEAAEVLEPSPRPASSGAFTTDLISEAIPQSNVGARWSDEFVMDYTDTRFSVDQPEGLGWVRAEELGDDGWIKDIVWRDEKNLLAFQLVKVFENDVAELQVGAQKIARSDGLDIDISLDDFDALSNKIADVYIAMRSLSGSGTVTDLFGDVRPSVLYAHYESILRYYGITDNLRARMGLPSQAAVEAESLYNINKAHVYAEDGFHTRLGISIDDQDAATSGEIPTRLFRAETPEQIARRPGDALPPPRPRAQPLFEPDDGNPFATRTEYGGAVSNTNQIDEPFPSFIHEEYNDLVIGKWFAFHEPNIGHTKFWINEGQRAVREVTGSDLVGTASGETILMKIENIQVHGNSRHIYLRFYYKSPEDGTPIEVFLSKGDAIAGRHQSLVLTTQQVRSNFSENIIIRSSARWSGPYNEEAAFGQVGAALPESTSSAHVSMKDLADKYIIDLWEFKGRVEGLGAQTGSPSQDIVFFTAIINNSRETSGRYLMRSKAGHYLLFDSTEDANSWTRPNVILGEDAPEEFAHADMLSAGWGLDNLQIGLDDQGLYVLGGGIRVEIPRENVSSMNTFLKERTSAASSGFHGLERTEWISVGSVIDPTNGGLLNAIRIDIDGAFEESSIYVRNVFGLDNTNREVMVSRQIINEDGTQAMERLSGASDFINGHDPDGAAAFSIRQDWWERPTRQLEERARHLASGDWEEGARVYGRPVSEYISVTYRENDIVKYTPESGGGPIAAEVVKVGEHDVAGQTVIIRLLEGEHGSTVSVDDLRKLRLAPEDEAEQMRRAPAPAPTQRGVDSEHYITDDAYEVLGKAYRLTPDYKFDYHKFVNYGESDSYIVLRPYLQVRRGADTFDLVVPNTAGMTGERVSIAMNRFLEEGLIDGGASRYVSFHISDDALPIFFGIRAADGVDIDLSKPFEILSSGDHGVLTLRTTDELFVDLGPAPSAAPAYAYRRNIKIREVRLNADGNQIPGNEAYIDIYRPRTPDIASGRRDDPSALGSLSQVSMTMHRLADNEEIPVRVMTVRYADNNIPHMSYGSGIKLRHLDNATQQEIFRRVRRLGLVTTEEELLESGVSPEDVRFLIERINDSGDGIAKVDGIRFVDSPSDNAIRRNVELLWLNDPAHRSHERITVDITTATIKKQDVVGSDWLITSDFMTSGFRDHTKTFAGDELSDMLMGSGRWREASGSQDSWLEDGTLVRIINVDEVALRGSEPHGRQADAIDTRNYGRIELSPESGEQQGYTVRISAGDYWEDVRRVNRDELVVLEERTVGVPMRGTSAIEGIDTSAPYWQLNTIMMAVDSLLSDPISSRIPEVLEILGALSIDIKMWSRAGNGSLSRARPSAVREIISDLIYDIKINRSNQISSVTINGADEHKLSFSFEILDGGKSVRLSNFEKNGTQWTPALRLNELDNLIGLDGSPHMRGFQDINSGAPAAHLSASVSDIGNFERITIPIGGASAGNELRITTRGSGGRWVYEFHAHGKRIALPSGSSSLATMEEVLIRSGFMRNGQQGIGSITSPGDIVKYRNSASFDNIDSIFLAEDGKITYWLQGSRNIDGTNTPIYLMIGVGDAAGRRGRHVSSLHIYYTAPHPLGKDDGLGVRFKATWDSGGNLLDSEYSIPHRGGAGAEAGEYSLPQAALDRRNIWEIEQSLSGTSSGRAQEGDIYIDSEVWIDLYGIIKVIDDHPTDPNDKIITFRGQKVDLKTKEPMFDPHGRPLYPSDGTTDVRVNQSDLLRGALSGEEALEAPKYMQSWRSEGLGVTQDEFIVRIIKALKRSNRITGDGDGPGAHLRLLVRQDEIHELEVSPNFNLRIRLGETFPFPSAGTGAAAKQVLFEDLLTELGKAIAQRNATLAQAEAKIEQVAGLCQLMNMRGAEDVELGFDLSIYFRKLHSDNPDRVWDPERARWITDTKVGARELAPGAPYNTQYQAIWEMSYGSNGFRELLQSIGWTPHNNYGKSFQRQFEAIYQWMNKHARDMGADDAADLFDIGQTNRAGTGLKSSSFDPMDEAFVPRMFDEGEPPSSILTARGEFADSPSQGIRTVDVYSPDNKIRNVMEELADLVRILDGELVIENVQKFWRWARSKRVEDIGDIDWHRNQIQFGGPNAEDHARAVDWMLTADVLPDSAIGAVATDYANALQEANDSLYALARNNAEYHMQGEMPAPPLMPPSGGGGRPPSGGGGRPPSGGGGRLPSGGGGRLPPADGQAGWTDRAADAIDRFQRGHSGGPEGTPTMMDTQGEYPGFRTWLRHATVGIGQEPYYKTYGEGGMHGAVAAGSEIVRSPRLVGIPLLRSTIGNPAWATTYSGLRRLTVQVMSLFYNMVVNSTAEAVTTWMRWTSPSRIVGGANLSKEPLHMIRPRHLERSLPGSFTPSGTGGRGAASRRRAAWLRANRMPMVRGAQATVAWVCIVDAVMHTLAAIIEDQNPNIQAISDDYDRDLANWSEKRTEWRDAPPNNRSESPPQRPQLPAQLDEDRDGKIDLLKNPAIFMSGRTLHDLVKDTDEPERHMEGFIERIMEDPLGYLTDIPLCIHDVYFLGQERQADQALQALQIGASSDPGYREEMEEIILEFVEAGLTKGQGGNCTDEAKCYLWWAERLNVKDQLVSLFMMSSGLDSRFQLNASRTRDHEWFDPGSSSMLPRPEQISHFLVSAIIDGNITQIGSKHSQELQVYLEKRSEVDQEDRDHSRYVETESHNFLYELIFAEEVSSNEDLANQEPYSHFSQALVDDIERFRHKVMLSRDSDSPDGQVALTGPQMSALMDQLDVAGEKIAELNEDYRDSFNVAGGYNLSSDMDVTRNAIHAILTYVPLIGTERRSFGGTIGSTQDFIQRRENRDDPEGGGSDSPTGETPRVAPPPDIR